MKYLDYAPPPLRSTWPFAHMSIVLVIVFIVQSVFFSSLDADGGSETLFGWAFDLLVLGRMLWAYVRKECSNDWRVYLTLMYTSPIWMVLLFGCISSMNHYLQMRAMPPERR